MAELGSVTFTKGGSRWDCIYIGPVMVSISTQVSVEALGTTPTRSWGHNQNKVHFFMVLKRLWKLSVVQWKTSRSAEEEDLVRTLGKKSTMAE